MSVINFFADLVSENNSDILVLVISALIIIPAALLSDFIKIKAADIVMLIVISIIITIIFYLSPLSIKTAVADEIIMQKHSYSEEYEISEKNDSIRKLEQYIKYREIELNDLKSEIKTEKEEVIIEALEEKAKNISQNIQFSKYALQQLKLGKSARIEYKQ